ncbi:VTT domain-containing protein [Chitinophaga sp. MM2321]|uniref:DedA family protein n=1 Tax=Chitinophaga sp. MM2321 TaxID=3137178 RepID=UPI0032D575AC
MFDTASLIKLGGSLLIFLVVYGQTGLFFCFFLPSGGFLFMGGVLVATGLLDDGLVTVCGLATLAAVLGNLTGYWIGRKAGPLLYRREDSRFFKKQYLLAAEGFYKKYGGIALSIGLFLPLIRTFGPIVGGILRLRFGHFLLYVFIGSLFWVVSFTMAGYLIGSMPFLKPYLKYVVIGIVFAVTLPVAIKVFREFRKRSTGGNERGESSK